MAIREVYDDEELVQYPRPVQFRLGLSRVYATADLFSTVFPHVLHLSITPRAWYRLARWMVAKLPEGLQTLVKTWFPGPFLPCQVALKQLAKTQQQYVELFNNEIRVYKKLHALQGKEIPIFYGEARCENRRAIVLSVVEGTTPFDQEKPISADEFQRRLEIAHRPFQDMSIPYSDKKLDNVILTKDGKLVFIDLEWLAEFDDRLELRCHLVVLDFMERYKRYLQNFEDGDYEILNGRRIIR